LKQPKKKIDKSKIFIFVIIAIFFTINFKYIDYGLPFFLNLDETAFLYSNLAFINFSTIFETNLANPIYAPLTSVILILKSILFNELIINYLSFDEIKSKIYFNPELFIYYGRFSSLLISSLSIFVLYLIFKKLKIRFIIYSLLLITFSSSLALLDVANIFGKNSYFLFFFLIQLYFFIKYLFKFKNFNIYSYITFGFLGSILWGINYWPAFISIYAIFYLHYKKFRLSNIKLLLIYLIIFIFFGPIINSIFVENVINDHIFSENRLSLNIFFHNFLKDFYAGIKILFFAEKNFILLLIFTPIFLIKKNINFKKEFLIIFVLVFEPIVVFSIAQNAFPQLRYFIGSISVILILISLIFNELYEKNSKIFYLVFLICNVLIINQNLTFNKELHQIIAKKHTFYNFNNTIEEEKRSKIFYIVDLGFQESLKQNLLYLDLYKNDLVEISEKKIVLSRIKNKIDIIKNTKNIIIDNYKLKKDITYFNYTNFKIKDLHDFFEYIKKNYDYVLIEETPVYYLSNQNEQNKIKNYVNENFTLEKIHSKEKKVFYTNLRSIIHTYLNVINKYDKAINKESINLDKVYGNNYSLYVLN
jgi:hypothetical protein